MKKHNLAQKGKRLLSMLLAAMMVLSCWVWVEPNQLIAEAANEAVTKDHYLFAYFTGTSKEGQTIHLAVSEDGYNYTALRGNEPVIIPSKGVGNVRDPYIWYNEQDNYYYILATDLDFTDGGGTYSNNSQSFIIWRSKDLVNWYDETFIDVSKMAHLIGDTRNMTAVWAPQVLWDGSAYVVYFTLACNATSWFDIVYLKTTDLMNPDAYYEFDYILGNSTGNGVCDTYGVIDADIIHNPGDGKYYLFYKTECNSNELGTTATGTSLKTIHYYVGDTPTGPFTNPGDTKWTDCGFSIFPDHTVSLEGCNSFFDNAGNLVMYADEFEHTNSLGEAEAYFHVARSSGYDFTSWEYINESNHTNYGIETFNINSLSPRHGSVVKITEAEYNRLLNNSYNITSSSYPETEDLSDHLVARYFTTLDDPLYNAVVGQPNLASATGITMHDSGSYGVYAEFDGSTAYAEVDFDSLFLNGLNYEDGFTITFSAQNFPMSSENSENNDRIYEIANTFGDQSSSTAYYTHFSPSGGGTGSYVGNYNGPVVSGEYDWLADKDGSNRDDNCIHDYIISYATGNVMVYVDGKLVISKNRFTTNVNGTVVPLDASWFKALGTESTMRIGKSGWDADPLFEGYIQNLCIYDCSMSYYDAQSMNDDYKENLGWVEENTYTGITSEVPTFSGTTETEMEQFRGNQFSNILYTSGSIGEPKQAEMTENNSAAYFYNNNDVHYGMFYAETTVLLIDGVNSATMPVMFGEECDNSDKSKYVYSVFPTDKLYTDINANTLSSVSDNTEISLTMQWQGWTRNAEYDIYMNDPADAPIGYKSTDTNYSSKFSGTKNHVAYWGSALKVNEDNIAFNGKYYKVFNLPWYVIGGKDSSYSPNFDSDGSHCGSMLSDHDIYVIDFRPILELRDSITKADYNSVMNNADLCPELREKYAAAVYEIRTMNPTDYGFAEAPVTATKACAKAISEAVGTYEGVMAEIAREEAAGSYGHQTADFEAREATCTEYGLTAGSYCTLCGEILEEQTLIAPCAHTFGDVYSEDGVKYVKCSVCGTVIEYQASEARYENLFSLNGWYDSSSNNVGNGTVSTNLTNGTITIVNQHTTEMYTRGTYDGQNLVTTRDFANYCIPVTGGDTYVVEGTSLSSSTSGGEIFVFQYTKDGLVYSAIPKVIAINPGETVNGEFTVDANAAYIELRFDCNDAGKTITYSDIGVYTKDSADKFAKTTADARLGFYPGDDKELCYPNPGDGYTFDGWYTSNGALIENVNQLNNPTTIVYGKWIYAGLDITYDSIFSFSAWAKSPCNQLWYGDVHYLTDTNEKGNLESRLISAEGIVADAEKGTISITWDADNITGIYDERYYNYGAKTNYWDQKDNLYYMPVDANTDYIIEFTASSKDGAKPNICAYFHDSDKNLKTHPEIGQQIRWSLGTHRATVNSGEEGALLVLRFDNSEIGTTITYSDIAVYKAENEALKFDLEAAQTIENRQYRRYYEQSGMGIGDVFEYTPTRPGYTFDTWMADTQEKDSNGNIIRDYDGIGDFDMKNLSDTFLVEQNWHLFSTWTENNYTVYFSGNNGSGSVGYDEGVNLAYTDTLTLPSGYGYTREGYYFAGWSLDQDATTPEYQPGDVVSKLTDENGVEVYIYAVWKKIPNEISYENLFQFSEWAASSSATLNTEKQKVGTMSLDGEAGTITFESQDTTDFYSNYSSADGFYHIPVTENVSYTLEFTVSGGEKNQAFVFYYDDDGQVNGTDGKSHKGIYPVGDGTHKLTFTAPTGATKVAFRFGTCTANSTVTFSNIALYRDDRSTEVDFDSWDSRYYRDTDLSDGLAQPSRLGYTFNGWFVDSDKNGLLEGNELNDPATNITTLEHDSYVVLSDWSLNKYTIKFNGNGSTGGSTADLAMTYNTAANLIANGFTKTGYTFTGWNTAADGTGTVYADKASVNNLTSEANATITLYAQWTANSYTIAFDGNGSTDGSTTSQSMTYDVEKALNANGFTRTGYEFAGWNTAANGSGTSYTDKQTVKNLATSGTATLYAQWTANSYTVEFDGNGSTGGSMTEQSITYDKATALATNAYTKTGYTFKGWSETKDGTVKYTDGQEVTNLAESGSVTLYAVWEANTYTIKFNANNGSGTMADLDMTYDTAKALTANTFTRTGYTFAGWSTSSTDSVKYADKESVKNLTSTANGTVTLYAVWSENTYTITFDANGGEGTTTQTVKYTETVTLPTTGFTRDGYDFVGWNSKADGTGTSYSTTVSGLSADANGSASVYAEWKINDSALVADTVVVDFGLPIEIKPVDNDEILIAEKQNGSSYTFNGLSTTKDGTYTNDIEGTYGDFTVSGETVTYTPSGIINGAENVLYYSVSVTVNGSTTTLTSTITVAPASNIYYEESSLTGLLDAPESYQWNSKTVADTTPLQSITIEDDIYGYDKAYDNANTFSNNTYLQANVTTSNKKSDTASFTFTGTGFDLIGACGKNTGVQMVKVKQLVDGNWKTIKLYIVDTYYNGDLVGDDGLLHQVPILSYRVDDNAGTYMVETTATYLNSSTAVKNGTAYFSLGNSETSTVSNEPSEKLIKELEELGIDDLDKDIEVIWMDDNSIFNGGTGSPNASVLSGSVSQYFNTTGSTAGLTNYVDGFRIYKNGGVDNYIEAEKNPTYYNIVDGIGGATLTGGSFTTYTETNITDIFGSSFDYTAYVDGDSPMGEIYLGQNQAVAFTFKANHAGSTAAVMLGMRVVSGTVTPKVTATLGGETKTTYPDVISATEMYYTVSPTITVSGDTGEVTMIIVNTGTGTLAVNNLKLVNGSLENSATLDDGTLSGSADAIGGTSSVPTPVVPTVDASQDDSDAPEADVENDVNAPETEVEDSVEEEADIAFEITGVPAPIASFLEMLFKFLGQLVGSFGF